MHPFNLSFVINENTVNLTISMVNGLYQIWYRGKIVGALRPPGEDWELLSMEEILAELPVQQVDLLPPDNIGFSLSDALIIQISGAIENIHKCE